MRKNIGTAKNRDGVMRFRQEMEDIRRRLQQGEWYDVIAEEYGVSKAMVYKHHPVNKIHEEQNDDEQNS